MSKDLRGHRPLGEDHMVEVVLKNKIAFLGSQGLLVTLGQDVLGGVVSPQRSLCGVPVNPCTARCPWRRTEQSSSVPAP